MNLLPSSPTKTHKNHPPIVLNQFCIYIPDFGSQLEEFAPLQYLRVKQTCETFLFDGFSIVNNAQFYVERVPFSRLCVGGYCDTSQYHVGDQVWICLAKCDSTDVWYQLRDPALEYARYYTSFLWIATFIRHLIDFLWTEG